MSPPFAQQAPHPVTGYRIADLEEESRSILKRLARITNLLACKPSTPHSYTCVTAEQEKDVYDSFLRTQQYKPFFLRLDEGQHPVWNTKEHRVMVMLLSGSGSLRYMRSSCKDRDNVIRRVLKPQSVYVIPERSHFQFKLDVSGQICLIKLKENPELDPDTSSLFSSFEQEDYQQHHGSASESENKLLSRKQ